MMADQLTRRAIFAQAWPIMLGQAMIPLVGIVDATVIGRTGDAIALAGVALGATIINLVFWSFGFLRMGMTGLTSQADGRGERDEVERLLLRSLLIGGGIGLALLLLHRPIGALIFALMAGGEQLTAESLGYVNARFLGAPAALAVYVLTGWLFGLGRTRHALALQIVMNVANIVLDIALVWGLGLGARGVGLGTAGAEWIALTTGLALCSGLLGREGLARLRTIRWAVLTETSAMRRLFSVNANLMIRTLALLLMFTWFANAGARLGATALAANHVLMQFIAVAAFILDAFAFTVESRIGNAIGAQSRELALRSIRIAGEFSLAGALILVLLFLASGNGVIAFITTDGAVRQEAMHFLIFAALIPLIGMPSWLLDGIFIGATRSTALRNAAIVSAALYLALDLSLRPYGNLGIWIAFCASYVLRAAALAWYIPALLRSVDTAR